MTSMASLLRFRNMCFNTRKLRKLSRPIGTAMSVINVAGATTCIHWTVLLALLYVPGMSGRCIGF